jgi:hypothetical protein
MKLYVYHKKNRKPPGPSYYSGKVGAIFEDDRYTSAIFFFV